MGTTLLFVELLVTGLQSSVWIFLVFVMLFGGDWLNLIDFEKLSAWTTLLTFFVLSFSYALGIMMDRVADFVFNKWNKRIGKKVIPNANRSFSVMRFELGEDNESLNNQFEYTRSRMRIARASSINFALIATFSLVNIITYLDLATNLKTRAIITTIIVGIILTSLAIYTWRELTTTYYELIKSNYKK